MNLEITLQQGSYVSFRLVLTCTLTALWKYFRKNFSDDLIIIKHKYLRNYICFLRTLQINHFLDIFKYYVNPS